ncbi:MAG: thiamine-phosphate kinase [Betaproteobacteria bacterium RIFCSPLOWO2_02_FULL_67_19]|nr:MAG: thiamine-phosphate kinase [Betaproteobacteria bacterium RIFCSPLOWO2_02_FULL_67_19]
MPSEFEIIRRFFDRPAASALLGVGDDAALVAVRPGMQLAVSTDLLLEGRHFRAGADPRKLGHKALAVNLSDMAAMGATPRWATLAIALPAADEAWLAAFADGLFALAARYGTELVGGDTTRGPLAICITILGEVPAGAALLRSGARSGDDIWVSGELGGAALALVHPGIAAAAARLDLPEPRVALGERLRGVASAAIDVSDGFAQDLGHILERSACGARVDYGRLPRAAAFAGLADATLERDCVLGGGDDYELLFTAMPSARDAIEAIARDLGLALTRVGSIVPGEASLELRDAAGRAMAPARGFDHFAP